MGRIAGPNFCGHRLIGSKSLQVIKYDLEELKLCQIIKYELGELTLIKYELGEFTLSQIIKYGSRE